MATHSSIVAWRIPGTGAWWATIYGVAQSRTQLTWLSSSIVKGFGIVNKAEEDIFLELSCFFDDPADVANLISASSTFSKTNMNIWKFTVEVYCWSLAWRILSITLLACEMSAIVCYFEHSLALPFFWVGMKTDLFQSSGHCWVFQMCWHIKCSTFTASSFRIWNSSTGIPSPPLALFVVMLS